MLAVIYLITMTIAGLAVVQRFMPNAPVMVRLAGGVLAGLVGSAWVTYAVALALSSLTDESLMIGILATLAVHGAIIGNWGRELRTAYFRLSPFEVIFIGLALAFSFWLMDNRLFVDTDQPGDPLVVSAETWGDTALHTALSKSFSEGTNYPTEYPFFAGESIRYHFGYDFFAGVLQRGDMSVGLSFNLPGAVGFAAMMMLLFSIAKFLFYPHEEETERGAWYRNKGVWVGLIAVAVLLTNQSLEFLRWFDPPVDAREPAALNHTIWDGLNPDRWWRHSGYLSIGPYYPDKIAIFNTLNVFLTQTHLIVGMGVVLFVAFGLLYPLRRGEALDRSRMALLGVVFGLSFWLNGVLFIASGVFFGTLLVIFALAGAYRHAQKTPSEDRFSQFGVELLRWSKDAAWFIVPALALAIPQAVWLNGGLSSDGSFRNHYGYLVCSSPNSNCHANGEMDFLNLSHWGEFVNYWILNEGLVFPLLIVAGLIGGRADRKILAAVMAVFVFGSLFQLSRDLGGHNHKIFNLWEVLAAPFVGYALVEMWNIGKRKLGSVDVGASTAIALRPLAIVAVPLLFVFLVLSGLLDFMTIKNDFHLNVFGDPPNQQAIKWVEGNTEKDAVFLTSWGDLYTVPTLAGRKVYLGYDPWAGSAGYDVEPRKQQIASIYSAPDRTTACNLLNASDIDYVLIGPDETRADGDKFDLNEGLFTGEFTTAATINDGGGQLLFTIFDVSDSCGSEAAVADAGG